MHANVYRSQHSGGQGLQSPLSMRWFGRSGGHFWAGFILGVAVWAVPSAASPAKKRAGAEAEAAPYERYFHPGALGYEPGLTQPKPSETAFITRALAGVARADDGTWSRGNALTKPLLVKHMLEKLLPPELYDRHPEYFAQEAGERMRPRPDKPGQRQPDLARFDVAAYTTEQVRTFFEHKPDEPAYGISINDTYNFGESPELLDLTNPVRWFRHRPDYSNAVFTFSNRVASTLAKSHPDKKLVSLAYYWAENSPSFGVHPQIIPFLTADRSQGYDPNFKAEDQTLQARWIEAMKAGVRESGRGKHNPLRRYRIVKHWFAGPNKPGHPVDFPAQPFRIGLYDYVYGRGFVVPRYYPHLLADSLRHARALGFTDYFAEVYPNWGLDGPQPWLLAQLLRNPFQEVDALLNEYFERYFKEAAAPMRRFYARCEAQWMQQAGPSFWLKHFHNESQATLFPSQVCRELRGMLDEAEDLAESEIVRERLRLVGDAFALTERFVAFQEAREGLNRMVLEVTSKWPDVLRKIILTRKAREEFEQYYQYLRETHPMLFTRPDVDMLLWHDPTINGLGYVWRACNTPSLAQAIIAESKDTELMRLYYAGLGQGMDLEINGRLEGELLPGKMVAGLPRSMALPRGWISRIEPYETHQSQIVSDEQGERSLRISGTRHMEIYRWILSLQDGLHLAEAEIRGKLSPGSKISFNMAWRDAQGRSIGLKMLHVPMGEWQSWRTITQGVIRPHGAQLVCVEVRLEFMAPDDWIEVRRLNLSRHSLN